MGLALVYPEVLVDYKLHVLALWSSLVITACILLNTAWSYSLSDLSLIYVHLACFTALIHDCTCFQCI